MKTITLSKICVGENVLKKKIPGGDIARDIDYDHSDKNISYAAMVTKGMKQ